MTNLLHQRPRERQMLRAGLLNGQSFLVLGPRRIGKTWLMKELANDMRGENWCCIAIDVEGKETEDEFLRALCQKILECKTPVNRLTEQVRQLARRIEIRRQDVPPLQGLFQIDYREFLDALINSLNEEAKPTLILIDELALFIQTLIDKDPAKAKAVLYYLRRLRQDYPNVRWYLTGSVGLDAIAHEHGVEGTLLGIEPIELGPFTAEEAETFIDEMFAKRLVRPRFSFCAGAFEYLVSEIGWLSPPQIAQVVVLIRPEGDPPVASCEAIEAAFVKNLEPRLRKQFAGWTEHIRKNYPKEKADCMFAILDILCDSMRGEMATTILTRLQSSMGLRTTPRQLQNDLSALQRGAYLSCTDERWHFLPGLLRRFWQESLRA